MEKRYVREYMRDLLKNAGPLFKKEIDSIYRACHNGCITSDEAVRLMAREEWYRKGNTDEQYYECKTFFESANRVVL